MKFKRNTQAIVRLAAEKSNQARRRVIEAINELQRENAAINFNTICVAARVSKTFIYDPKHSDLAEQIRSLRQANPQSPTNEPKNPKKVTRPRMFRSFVSKNGLGTLRNRFERCREENELLYGKLS